jgi:hypothetical protein
MKTWAVGAFSSTHPIIWFRPIIDDVRAKLPEIDTCIAAGL